MNHTTSSEKIERIFEKYFQKTISLSINNEQIKRGKFLLIKNCILGNNYFYELTIERSKKLDHIKIPYPFVIEEYEEDNLLYLDYRIKSIFKNTPELSSSLQQWLKQIDMKNCNKLFDNILEIKFE